jgi:hypothetical protein
MIAPQVREEVLKTKQSCKLLKLFSYHRATFPKTLYIQKNYMNLFAHCSFILGLFNDVLSTAYI